MRAQPNAGAAPICVDAIHASEPPRPIWSPAVTLSGTQAAIHPIMPVAPTRRNSAPSTRLAATTASTGGVVARSQTEAGEYAGRGQTGHRHRTECERQERAEIAERAGEIVEEPRRR